MSNLKNNQALINRLNLLIDNELPKEAEQELLKQIKTNPDFREMLDRERSFRKFIKSNISHRKVSPTLIESIKEKIYI